MDGHRNSFIVQCDLLLVPGVLNQLNLVLVSDQLVLRRFICPSLASSCSALIAAALHGYLVPTGGINRSHHVQNGRDRLIARSSNPLTIHLTFLLLLVHVSFPETVGEED